MEIRSAFLFGIGIGMMIARAINAIAFAKNPEYFCGKCKYREKRSRR